MNKFQGKISNIEVSGSMSLVEVELSQKRVVKAIVIETPDTADYLSIGNVINILFKETEVFLGIGDPSISIQNKIPAEVISIDSGRLISSVLLQTEIGELTSIISTNAVENLKLKPGSEVTAYIKLNEVMLSK